MKSTKADIRNRTEPQVNSLYYFKKLINNSGAKHKEKS
jgi:hypothetical protein